MRNYKNYEPTLFHFCKKFKRLDSSLLEYVFYLFVVLAIIAFLPPLRTSTSTQMMNLMRTLRTFSQKEIKWDGQQRSTRRKKNMHIKQLTAM